MPDRIKVYEETAKKKGLPIWAWLLPLLLLLALLVYFLTRHPAHNDTATNTAPVATNSQATAMPDLGSVHFDTDKATLTSEGQATLMRAATFMKGNPSAHLRLEGYTDSTGSTPHNADLSEQRASTVANFLKAQGVEGSRITGTGFGPSNPTDTNSTAGGKADNRRVELFTQQ